MLWRVFLDTVAPAGQQPFNVELHPGANLWMAVEAGCTIHRLTVAFAYEPRTFSQSNVVRMFYQPRSEWHYAEVRIGYTIGIIQ